MITIQAAGIEVKTRSIGIDTTESTPYLTCRDQPSDACDVGQLLEFFTYTQLVRLDIGEGRVLVQIVTMTTEPHGYVLRCHHPAWY